ncbi:Maternally expressed PAB C-terminal protein [Hirschfeldia incana]|nr:Maternally expressed PAB C-terminal protein [Hirschfeldia incana]
MIGDFLYRLVEQLERTFTAKITGMLLEIDRTELFRLMESPRALRGKVKEAIEVLGDWIPQQLEKDAYELQASMLSHKL